MNISKSSYQNFTDAITGSGNTWVQRLYALYSTLAEWLTDTFAAELDLISQIYSLLPINSGTIIDELVDPDDSSYSFYWWDIFDDYQIESAKTNKGQRIYERYVYSMLSGIDSLTTEVRIYDNGTIRRICDVNDNPILNVVKELVDNKIHYLVTTAVGSVRTANGNLLVRSSAWVEDILRGKMLMNGYVNSIQQSLTLPWEIDFHAALNSFNSILQNTVGMTKEAASELMMAAASGTDSLISYFNSLFTKTKQTMESSVDGFYNSTSIVLNQFAAGLVLKSIGTILSLIGSICLAFGGIITKITAIITLIGGFICQFISNIIEEKSGVKFSIHTKGNQAFGFVVNQTTITNTGLANAIRAVGANGATVSAPNDPSCFLVYLPNETQDTVLIEEHISTCFDMTKSVVLVPGTYPYYSGNKLKLGRFGYNDGSSFHNEIGILIPHNFQESDFTGLCEDSFSPTEFGLWDKVSSVFNDDDFQQGTLAIRLASGCYLWALKYLSTIGFIVQDYDLNNPGSLPVNFYYNFSNTSQYRNGGASLGLVRNLLAKSEQLLCSCFGGTADMTDTFIKYDSSNGYLDNLLLAIKNCFDGLAYVQPVYTSAAYSSAVYGIVVLAGADIAMAEKALTNSTYYSALGAPLLNYVSGVNVSNGCHVDPVTRWANESTGFVAYCKLGRSLMSRNYNTFSPGWTTDFTVDIPTTTFTGFVAGLIVDGIIVLAAVTVATIGVIGYMKLRNRRAQLQAQAEAEWYNYQDAVSSGADGTYYWNRYRTSRFKYNALSLLTGGTILGMGLYDDTSYVSGIFDSVSNLVSSKADSSDDLITDVSDALNSGENSLASIKSAINNTKDSIITKITGI